MLTSWCLTSGTKPAPGYKWDGSIRRKSAQSGKGKPTEANVRMLNQRWKKGLGSKPRRGLMLEKPGWGRALTEFKGLSLPAKLLHFKSFSNMGSRISHVDVKCPNTYTFPTDRPKLQLQTKHCVASFPSSEIREPFRCTFQENLIL